MEKLSYEERFKRLNLTALKTRNMRSDLPEVLKITIGVYYLPLYCFLGAYPRQKQAQGSSAHFSEPEGKTGH